MPKRKSKQGSKSSSKKKTLANLHPNLPFLPDTPDRPQYHPLADTVDHLRNCHESLPVLPDEIDTALDNLSRK